MVKDIDYYLLIANSAVFAASFQWHSTTTRVQQHTYEMPGSNYSVNYKMHLTNTYMLQLEEHFSGMILLIHGTTWRDNSVA